MDLTGTWACVWNEKCPNDPLGDPMDPWLRRQTYGTQYLWFVVDDEDPCHDVSV